MKNNVIGGTGLDHGESLMRSGENGRKPVGKTLSTKKGGGSLWLQKELMKMIKPKKTGGKAKSSRKVKRDQNRGSVANLGEKKQI